MYLSDINTANLTEEQIDGILFSDRNEWVNKSDYAILLGAAPKHAENRAEIAASFYFKKGTRAIITSGGAVYGKSVTESQLMRKSLISLGVPESAIIEEARACDTIQNLTCSLTEICKRRDVMTVEAVTVITEPFHLKRALCLAEILLPAFIRVYGYTEGTAKQRSEWKTDETLNKCVKTEIDILKQLIEKGRIPDLKL